MGSFRERLTAAVLAAKDDPPTERTRVQMRSYAVEVFGSAKQHWRPLTPGKNGPLIQQEGYFLHVDEKPIYPEAGYVYERDARAYAHGRSLQNPGFYYRVITPGGTTKAVYFKGEDIMSSSKVNLSDVPVVEDRPKVKLAWAVMGYTGGEGLNGSTLQANEANTQLTLRLECGDEISFDAERLQAAIDRARGKGT